MPTLFSSVKYTKICSLGSSRWFVKKFSWERLCGCYGGSLKSAWEKTHSMLPD
jgi:hypothetical protein